MIECVVSDTSFFSCFSKDLSNKDILYDIINLYQFIIGTELHREISTHLSDGDKFFTNVNHFYYKYDYFSLILPFLTRNQKHLKDGEYEAIGISYFIKTEGDILGLKLKYLIIDERKGRNFVSNYFPLLVDNLVGTIGFIRDCCLKDKKISCKSALSILYCIKKKVEIYLEKGGKRPCSMDSKSYDEILLPLIKIIEGDLENG